MGGEIAREGSEQTNEGVGQVSFAYLFGEPMKAAPEPVKSDAAMAASMTAGMQTDIYASFKPANSLYVSSFSRGRFLSYEIEARSCLRHPGAAACRVQKTGGALPPDARTGNAAGRAEHARTRRDIGGDTRAGGAGRAGRDAGACH